MIDLIQIASGGKTTNIRAVAQKPAKRVPAIPASPRSLIDWFAAQKLVLSADR